MRNQDDIYYQAVLTRDPRFDGKFFIGVKTTGIYCRPICPAKPKRENMEVFPDAHAAEKAGYRPCLRCRPECAPLSPAWNGRSAVVNRALRLIACNALLDANEDEFASQLGVTARQLRRLFEEEVGKTPKQISDANRLAPDPKCLYATVQAIRRIFDLDLDPVFVGNVLSVCPVLAPLTERYPGLRLARGFDPFETAISSILGQLVSVEQARRLVQRLVETRGEAVLHPVTGERRFLFPTPEALARDNLEGVGTTQARKRTIREFARAVRDKEIVLHGAQDPASLRVQLLRVPGIGAWTADYISLRALGETDAFPATDLILKRAVERYPAISLDQVRPWRAYAAIYLWRAFAAALSKKKPGGVRLKMPVFNAV